MRFCAYLLVMALSAVPAVQLFAQKIVKQWEARYSEPGRTKEVADQLKTDPSGNVVVLGGTNEDAILLKYDPSGKILWTFQAGRGVFMEEKSQRSSRDFVVDGNGNSYLAVYGHTQSKTSYGVAIIKIDTNGKEVWRKMLGGYYDAPHMRLALLGDNSVAVFHRTGYTDLSLSRLSTAGDILWTKKVNNPGAIQDIRFLNNNIVLYYNAGLYVQTQKANIEVYNIDGTLAWANTYQYEGKNSTVLAGLCYYNNEFIVTYYVYVGPESFNQVFRYNASTGAIVKNFTIYMDYTFNSDSPMDVTAVGNDGEIMVVDADDLEVRKYSLSGTLLWRRSFDMGSEWEYVVMGAWPHPETSSVDVLLKTRKLTNGSETYSVTSFLPDKTSKVVANLSAARRDVMPASFVESGADIFIAGTFYNGYYYQEDLTLTKLTTANVHAWTTAYAPLNSLINVPTCIATDAQGSVYTAGMLWIDDGPNGFGVIKYDPTGKQVWVKKIAPGDKKGDRLSYTMVLAMVVNANQEVYITGMVDSGRMSDGSMGETPRDLYTIKLDVNGNTLWTKKAASTTDDDNVGFQLALDSQNNLYVLGFNMSMKTSERTKMVLLKYDNNGNEQWERRFGLYPHYRVLSSTGRGLETPVLKMFRDEAYVLYGGQYMSSSAYRDVVEVRKFSGAGTETLVWQKQCSEVDWLAEDSHARARDLHLDADGTLYIAYSYYFVGQNIYGSPVIYGSEMRLQAVKPSGKKLWEKSWPVEKGSVDRMKLAGGADQLYVLGITTTNFHYISAATSDGNEIWHKSEALMEDSDYYDRQGFAFTTADGNAMFGSSDLTEHNSGHYFICERDRKTGAVTTSETFDEIYDSYGVYIFRPADILTAACLSADHKSLFVTGYIQDKARQAETMVTLKYSLRSINDGDGSEDDGGEDDDGNNPVTSIEPGAEQALAAYPTLNRGVFHIHGLTRESTDIQVFDTFGQYVCRFDPSADSFDLTVAPAGIYLIRIQHRGQWYTTKIMKE